MLPLAFTKKRMLTGRSNPSLLSENYASLTGCCKQSLLLLPPSSCVSLLCSLSDTLHTCAAFACFCKICSKQSTAVTCGQYLAGVHAAFRCSAGGGDPDRHHTVWAQQGTSIQARQQVKPLAVVRAASRLTLYHVSQQTKCAARLTDFLARCPSLVPMHVCVRYKLTRDVC